MTNFIFVKKNANNLCQKTAFAKSKSTPDEHKYNIETVFTVQQKLKTEWQN